MPLKSVFSIKLISEDFAEDSPIIRRATKFLGERAMDSIDRRMKKYVKQRPNVEESGFSMFGIVLGDNGQMPKTDYEYCWNKAIECFGDTDDAKKFLGSMLMKAFAQDDENWLFVQDPEKKQKLSKGDTPDATRYFLDRTGKGYEGVKGGASTKSSSTPFTTVNRENGNLGNPRNPVKGQKVGTVKGVVDPSSLASLASKFSGIR